jgi:hypothetical protein
MGPRGVWGAMGPALGERQGERKRLREAAAAGPRCVRIRCARASVAPLMLDGLVLQSACTHHPFCTEPPLVPEGVGSDDVDSCRRLQTRIRF